MAIYTVSFWKLTIDGKKGDALSTLSGEFESELEALEGLNEQFRGEYEGNFVSEIQI